ncbi:MAG TPA: DUF4055 domain-containing protein [Alphaproteobacteria bacterium]|nr:DUF4055 domain-containing protein [Alphaproteobacteria bacterium]
MADKKDANDPSTTSYAWDAMAPKWDMIETLLSGTDAMRDAGEKYLPRHSEESDGNYDERLERCTLFNMMELTLEALVGKPFSDPLKINDDVPQEIQQILHDVDLQGNDISTFARHWFREGLAKSFAHVLVDYPVLTEEQRRGRTLADDRREGRRPYWVLIKPENVIFAAAENINGREVLTHVRIKEEVVVREGFAENVVSRVRVLEPGMFQVWEFVRQNKRRKGEWKIVAEGATGLNFIPLVTFYSNRSSLMFGKPPLEDLAHLNIRHWQSTADQINVLTVARFPILAVAGATDSTGTTMAIGPRQLLGTKDPNGRFYYVEHSGKAIEAGRQDLMDLEQMMASYGAEFLKRRSGNVTATGRALDSAEAMSSLQDAAIRFNDTVNKALDMTATWLDLPDGGTVEIKQDYGPSKVSDQMLKTLLEARKNGDLSREDLLDQLKQLQILSDDFNPAVNLMRLMMEAAGAGIDTALIDPADFLNNGSHEPSDQDADEGGAQNGS